MSGIIVKIRSFDPIIPIKAENHVQKPCRPQFFDKRKYTKKERKQEKRHKILDKRFQ